MIQPLTNEHVTKCGENLLRSTLKSHSYPYPPTMDNRHKFPGILVQPQMHEKDDSFSTDAISKQASSGEKYHPQVEVKKDAWKRNVSNL